MRQTPWRWARQLASLFAYCIVNFWGNSRASSHKGGYFFVRLRLGFFLPLRFLTRLEQDIQLITARIVITS